MPVALGEPWIEPASPDYVACLPRGSMEDKTQSTGCWENGPPVNPSPQGVRGMGPLLQRHQEALILSTARPKKQSLGLGVWDPAASTPYCVGPQTCHLASLSPSLHV